MTVRKVSNNPASPFYNANCPNLTGQAGSLTTWLDAVLVNGFSGFTALGWTIGQTTTNKRQYIMGAGGTGFSLWVDDTAPTTAKEARCVGFETMSATTPTGTGQFPTGAQSSIGIGYLAIRKSTTADSTVRYATIIGDARTFYLFTETGDFTGTNFAVFTFSFGDFIPYSATDTSYCHIIGRQIENTPNSGPGNVGATAMYEGWPILSLMNSTGLSNVINGHYIARNFTNTGGSIQFGKNSDQALMGAASGGGGNVMGIQGVWTTNTVTSLFINQFNLPNGPDGGLMMAPVRLHHQGNLRGYLRGIWCPLQHQPQTHNDVFSGTGALAGKDFVCQVLNGLITGGAGGTGGQGGQVFVEKSDTWP